MDSKTAVGAEGMGMKAAGVLGTEPAQGSGDTLVDTAYYSGHTHKDCSPWAWAFGNTRDTLDRWGTGSLGLRQVFLFFIRRMYSVIACSVKMYHLWKVPGSPVIETPHFQCRRHGFDPWSGN